MTHILHIDCSPRGDRSHSRTLANEFISTWKNTYPNNRVTYRDLGHQVIPPVTETWIAGAFSPPDTHTPELKAALLLSEEAIEEFIGVDRYVFSVPMYNFGIPANLKAYIDQICRVNRTFTAKTDGSYEGLVKDKKMLVITARGGSYLQGTPAEQYDFQEPYIRTIFGVMGVIDITFVHAENLAQKGEVRDQSLSQARNALQALITGWS